MTMGESSRLRRQPPQKLTVEQYLDFIHSQKQLDLSVCHLNQIIDMHGFKKIKTHKRILMEIVKTMEVMDPSRSTLEDDAVSSNALLTMDDLVKDLNELKWQECCVTSLQTINAVDHHHHHHHEISNNESPALTLASEEPKRPRERLKKLIDNGADEDGDLPLTCFEYGDSQMALMCSSSAVMKWVPRKKNRSLKCIQLNANGDRAE